MYPAAELLKSLRVSNVNDCDYSRDWNVHKRPNPIVRNGTIYGEIILQQAIFRIVVIQFLIKQKLILLKKFWIQQRWQPNRHNMDKKKKKIHA